ncbi:MAG: DinB family protein [Formosimonas sp.]
MAANLWVSLFQYKAWANQELFVALEEVKSTEKRHAATRLLNHIYVVDCIFAAHLQGKSHAYQATNTPETPTLSDLRQAVSELDDWYIQYVGGLNEDMLNEQITFTFTDQAAGRMSRGEMLAHIITHGGYHRGAVGRIMFSASVAPPRDIFTAFLHQSEPSRRD